jgi:hypothetical protein
MRGARQPTGLVPSELKEETKTCGTAAKRSDEPHGRRDAATLRLTLTSPCADPETRKRELGSMHSDRTERLCASGIVHRIRIMRRSKTLRAATARE